MRASRRITNRECMERRSRRAAGRARLLGLHTAHAIEQAHGVGLSHAVHAYCGNCTRTSSAPIAIPSTRSLGSLGGYVETARCWTATERMGYCLPPIPARLSTGQSGENLRPVPCGRQRELCSVSAARQRAQSHTESRALLCKAVHDLLLFSVLTFFMIHTILG